MANTPDHQRRRCKSKQISCVGIPGSVIQIDLRIDGGRTANTPQTPTSTMRTSKMKEGEWKIQKK